MLEADLIFYYPIVVQGNYICFMILLNALLRNYGGNLCSF